MHKSKSESGFFSKFANSVARALGHPYSFVLAILVVVIWALTGPIFGYSDTWQLVINTGTTVVTFIMVFLIQNTQNRDSRAMQLKLDELVFAVEGASNALIDIEEMSDQELDEAHRRYEQLAKQVRERLERGPRDDRGDRSGRRKGSEGAGSS